MAERAAIGKALRLGRFWPGRDTRPPAAPPLMPDVDRHALPSSRIMSAQELIAMARAARAGRSAI